MRIDVPLALRAPSCVAASPADHYFHVVYARATDDVDHYATRAPQIRDLVRQADGHLNDATTPFGRTADYKVLCSLGEIVVENRVLPTPKASTTFETVVTDLRAQGFDSGREKYWVFFDENLCNCGVGHVYNDTRASGAVNANNGNAASMFAVSFGVLDWSLWMHEAGHNLGAVQSRAPGATWRFHCNDGNDVMCYADGASNSAYDASVCPGAVERWDCNNDNYYHPSPPAGNWLATNWNVGSPENRFLTIVPAGANAPPTVTSLVCSPASLVQGASAGCTFSASDDSAGIAFTVDWGGGTPSERVPASGHVAPGTEVTRFHAWGSGGTFTVSVSATDDGTPPLTSTPRTTSVAVNGRPVMGAVTCAPSPVVEDATATCSFQATDASSGVFYTVDWGDGSPATRVPSSGTVAPGTTRQASHAWHSAGAPVVSVTATDDGSPPATSNPATFVQTVTSSPCALERSGSMSLGQPLLLNSANTASFDVTVCRGAPWSLRATGGIPPPSLGTGGSRFDLCWTAAGRTLGCQQGWGDKSGVVPQDATGVQVIFAFGAMGSWEFRAG